MEFSKPALTAQQHLDLLLQRKLVVKDPDRALHHIQYLGYFRLTGYMYPLQSADGTHQFKSDTSFEQVIDFYNFDRKLRFLILDFIERIEVGLRAVISDTYAMKCGAHWYLDANLFGNITIHSDFTAKVKAFCNDCEFQFIKAYINKYDAPAEPPSWMIMETLTFGQLSNLFDNLKGGPVKSEVAERFSTASPILKSWLMSINSLRNFCAHHSRVWNRKFAIKPTIPVQEKWKFLMTIEDDTNWRLYGILSCMIKMMEKINPTSDFKTKLKELFQEYKGVNIKYMGFDKDWENEGIWK